jgi:hypothetical protein
LILHALVSAKSLSAFDVSAVSAVPLCAVVPAVTVKSVLSHPAVGVFQLYHSAVSIRASTLDLLVT